MLFSLLKHYLELYVTDTAVKVSRSLYCFTTFISHGVKNYFPRLWGMGISNAIFSLTIAGISLLSCIYVLGHNKIPLCEYQAWVFLKLFFLDYHC